MRGRHLVAVAALITATAQLRRKRRLRRTAGGTGVVRRATGNTQNLEHASRGEVPNASAWACPRPPTATGFSPQAMAAMLPPWTSRTAAGGWSSQTNLPLSAGPAYGDGILALGTTDGDLIALEAETGSELWRRAVGAEVLAPPVIADEVVALRTVDGRLRGYSSLDGREIWAVVQSVPALTMRGNTAPYAAGTSVVAGFDNGRLGAYELATGDVLWEFPVRRRPDKPNWTGWWTSAPDSR